MGNWETWVLALGGVFFFLFLVEFGLIGVWVGVPLLGMKWTVFTPEAVAGEVGVRTTGHDDDGHICFRGEEDCDGGEAGRGRGRGKDGMGWGVHLIAF